MLVCVIILIALEFSARAIGLGDPIIYYNSAWGGLRPLPNQHVSRLKGSTVTIDVNGFRSKGPDSENALRILYLGDSVTWGGSSVDDEKLFSEVAADVLRNTGLEIYAMNSGVNGTSLSNQAEIFMQWQDSVDVVIWLFPWNDVYRAYAASGLLWPPNKRPLFALVEVIDHVIRTRWLTSFREQTSAAGEEFISPETPAGYEQFYETVLADRTRKNLRALEQAVQIALRDGIPVVAGITPRRVGNRLLSFPAEAADVLRSLEGLGVQIMDVAAVFSSGVNLERAFIDEVHFTTEGHRLVGEALGSELLMILHEPMVDEGDS